MSAQSASENSDRCELDDDHSDGKGIGNWQVHGGNGKGNGERHSECEGERKGEGRGTCNGDCKSPGRSGLRSSITGLVRIDAEAAGPRGPLLAGRTFGCDV